MCSAAVESPSLRRHYPGQVRRSAAPQPPSQPGRSELPLVPNRIAADRSSERSAKHSGASGPQLCERVLFRQGLRERLQPVSPLPPCHETTDDHNRHAACCRRAAPAGRRLHPAAHVMQDDAQVRGATAETLDEFDRLGVDIVKVNLFWDEVAPNRRRKPAGLRRRRPRRLLLVELRRVINGDHRPRHAALPQPGRARPALGDRQRGRRGTYRPNAKEFGRFAEAAGRQFPKVDIWSIWNEPNLYSWLSPQRRKRVPVSPSIYRKPLPRRPPRPAAPGPTTTRSCCGELMPRGGTDRRKVPPLQFLREMACLDRNYRQYRGRRPRSAAARACRPHPHLRPRLPPLHARRRPQGERGARRRRHRPARPRAQHARRARPARQAPQPA